MGHVRAAVPHLMVAVIGEFDRVDVLVHNAGGTHSRAFLGQGAVRQIETEGIGYRPPRNGSGGTNRAHRAERRMAPKREQRNT